MGSIDEIIRMKRLYLSDTNKKVMGLCGGIAEYAEVDTTVVRLIVLTIIIMCNVLPGILLYTVAAAITPRKGATN